MDPVGGEREEVHRADTPIVEERPRAICIDPQEGDAGRRVGEDVPRHPIDLVARTNRREMVVEGVEPTEGVTRMYSRRDHDPSVRVGGDEG